MSIKINSLKIDKLSDRSLDKNYLYKDLALDLSQQVSFNNQLNRKEYLKDVQALFDVEAVKNSIANALLTSPGEKILNPTYGIDLRQFLFEPIDDFTANIIRDDIEDNLPEMEPRISLKNVEVMGDEDANTYWIYLEIDIPSLDIFGVSLKSQLNSTGYTIL
jgi:phage baseplate assembly protein W